MEHAQSVSQSKRIVVSGINGYIAAVLGLQVLRAGHTLVGTSRSAAHEDALRAGPYAAYGSRFVYHHVPDMSADGAFDAALAGSHAFVHTASPIGSAQSAEAIAPAALSVESALKSATRAGSQFSAFVYMSSIAAVIDRDVLAADPAHAFSEADWNEQAVREVRTAAETGAPAMWFKWYSASKVAAERALFASAADGELGFAVSSVLPAFVYGPPVLTHAPATAEQLSMSLQQIFALYSAGEGALSAAGADAAECYVDVRDVVAMCMWLVEHPEQGNGQRFLAAKGAATAREIWNVLNGETGGDYGWREGQSSLKSTKAEELMGIKFRGLEGAVLDTCEAFAAVGVKRAS